MKLTNHLVLTLLVGMLVLFMGSNSAMAQSKIRYIDSQKVLDNYPAWQDVQKQLDELRQKYEGEFEQIRQEAENLYNELQNQSLLLSPEKKAEKESQLLNLQAQLERYQREKFGPQGEFYRKNAELTEPIITKINQIIKKIGEEDGLDYILDVAQGVVLFAKPEFDITDRVLEELNKAQ